MNKIIITMLSIIVISIGSVIALIIYKENKSEISENNIEYKIAEEKITDECTDEYEEMQENMIQTNSESEKISPNCFITFNVNHSKCGHVTSIYEKVSDNLVNKTKEELKNYYSNWNIDEFSDLNIVLSKNDNDYCGEHYLIQDRDGKVIVYKVLEDGTKKYYENTDIATEYLSDADKLKIKEGININGKQNLNQFIEDFE